MIEASLGTKTPDSAENSCAHQWAIEAPSGPTSRGVCKVCGAEREFYNSAECYSIPLTREQRKRFGMEDKSLADGSRKSYGYWSQYREAILKDLETLPRDKVRDKYHIPESALAGLLFRWRQPDRKRRPVLKVVSVSVAEGSTPSSVKPDDRLAAMGLASQMLSVGNSGLQMLRNQGLLTDEELVKICDRLKAKVDALM